MNLEFQDNQPRAMTFVTTDGDQQTVPMVQFTIQQHRSIFAQAIVPRDLYGVGSTAIRRALFDSLANHEITYIVPPPNIALSLAYKWLIVGSSGLARQVTAVPLDCLWLKIQPTVC